MRAQKATHEAEISELRATGMGHNNQSSDLECVF